MAAVLFCGVVANDVTTIVVDDDYRPSKRHCAKCVSLPPPLLLVCDDEDDGGEVDDMTNEVEPGEIQDDGQGFRVHNSSGEGPDELPISPQYIPISPEIVPSTPLADPFTPKTPEEVIEEVTEQVITPVEEVTGEDCGEQDS